MTIAIERQLQQNIEGDILFDEFSRGRYSTDASIYQMLPAGVIVPKSISDVKEAIFVAVKNGMSVLPRGAGTSQCGQTVNESLVIDNTKYLKNIYDLDVEKRRVTVEPGVVLDELNRFLAPHGLCFPVDVSTSSRATIGGMTANNSCGGRSIRYGMMRDNVAAIDAVMSDGSEVHFSSRALNSGLSQRKVDSLIKLGESNREIIGNSFPNVMRRVGGYNIDALVNTGDRINPIDLMQLVVGSEGTLAYFSQIELKLSPVLKKRVIGVCHFPDFHQAMDAAQYIVRLGPLAVELVDDTMIALARNIPMFNSQLERFVKGEPAALLLVEFSEPTDAANLDKLSELEAVMADLGLSWQGKASSPGGVLRVIDSVTQADISNVRTSGLNIMMSMKSAGKPVSFVEDCAVELPDLADYTAGLNEIFSKHGTRGTWYAHASVGCLHVRPVLNLKLDSDLSTMRAIAEETFELVRNYKGSHSGEHGDGIVRSEFHEQMFGKEMVSAFECVKDILDPVGLFNPGKIVRAPKMDDRSVMRFHENYLDSRIETALEWSDWPDSVSGFQGAVEMCNNNGACRKLEGGVMCPSYRVTRNEKDLTRGRANSLRLALSGQLGSDALASDEMQDSMKLCVGCKGCKRECPTGVDMAKMKIEVSHAYVNRYGLTLHDRLVAWLPRYAPYLSKAPRLLNLRNKIPALAKFLEGPTGFTATRMLPLWSLSAFSNNEAGKSARRGSAENTGKKVALFADTFNRYFEPENLRAALGVLLEAGYGVEIVSSNQKDRNLCCGRTFLTAGLVDEAKKEAQRLVTALLPYAEKGIPVVGLEPSCLLALRDEIPVMLPGRDAQLVAENALMFEEFFARELDMGRLNLTLKPLEKQVLLHGHCHQKAFGMMNDIERTLQLIPGLTIDTINSGCCGMAGAFGYATDTADISLKMAELDLFPALRKSSEEVIVVADGTSCRHQIKDGTKREALHVARILQMSL